jgi:SH3-like domain-containing protein
MYLIKGDEVEVLEEKGEWLKIRYYGKKVVEGWIKRSDVD